MSFKKKPYKERISKLMEKIKIRINMQYGEEVNPSMYDLENLFPTYSRAIKRLSAISKTREEILPTTLVEREPEIIAPMWTKTGSYKFLRCGGGHLVRKFKKRSDRAW